MDIKIRASVRISTPINNTHYTFEYSEERTTTEEMVESDRKKLWDLCVEEVENQIFITQELYKKTQKKK